MENVIVKLNEKGKGDFLIKEGAVQMGEMVVSMKENSLTVYHTEVAPEAEGQGLAKKLLAAMVQYAREKKLQVIPLCPFVHAQFKRNPAEYADVWNSNPIDSTID